MKKTVLIEGMSCKHCAAQVKNSLEDLGAKVKVDLKSGSALVKSKLEISDADIERAITSGGFSVKGIE